MNRNNLYNWNYHWIIYILNRKYLNNNNILKNQKNINI